MIDLATWSWYALSKITALQQSLFNRHDGAEIRAMGEEEGCTRGAAAALTQTAVLSPNWLASEACGPAKSSGDPLAASDGYDLTIAYGNNHDGRSVHIVHHAAE